MAKKKQPKARPGDIYVVTNDCYRKVSALGRYKGVGRVSPVKIGRGVEFADRIGSLSAAVFDEFLIHLVLRSKDVAQSETDLHEYFSDCRIKTDKFNRPTEFFAGPLEEIIKRTKKYAKNHALEITQDHGLPGEPLGRSAVLIKRTIKEKEAAKRFRKLIETNQTKPAGKKMKKAKFNFGMVGLSNGAHLVFIPTGAKVTAVVPNKVRQGGKERTLTGYAKEFMPAKMRNSKDAYQGPAYFAYKGKKLTEWREEMEGE